MVKGNRAMCMLCLALLNLLSAPILLIFMFDILPNSSASAMREKMVLDSERKWMDLKSDEMYSFVDTFTFFNLTNAYELQTQVPAPKPVLREVKVNFTRSVQQYSFAPNEDGTEASFKVLQYQTPVHADDLNLVIVNVNALLLQMIQLAGTESLLGPTLNMAMGMAMGDPTIGDTIMAMIGYDAMPALLRPDGTGAANVGPFTRRTVGELLQGWTDPYFAPAGLNIFTQAPTGLWMGMYQIPTTEMQEAAIAAGMMQESMITFAMTTGKKTKNDMNDMNDISKFVRYMDQPNVSAGQPFYPGWGLDGTAGAPFVYEGSQFTMGFGACEPPLSKWPSIFEAGLSGTKPKVKHSKETLTLMDDSLLFGLGSMRMMQYLVTGEEMYGKTHTTVYEMDTTTEKFKLAVGGTIDETGACAATATCDYGMRYDGTFDARNLLFMPVAFTLPYLGETPAAVRDAVTILPANGTTELAYDPSSMRPKIWLEPFSGLYVKTRLDRHMNHMVEQTMLDGTLFANVFSSDTDNNNVLVMPYFGVHMESGATISETDKMGPVMEAAYLFMLIIFVIAICSLLLAILFGWCYLKKDSASVEPATVVKPEKMCVPPKDTRHTPQIRYTSDSAHDSAEA